jgi:hypothetical protein
LNSLAYRDLAGGAERGESFDLDLSGDLCVVDSLRPSGRRWQPPSWPGRDRRHYTRGLRPRLRAWSTAFRGIGRDHQQSSPPRSWPMSIVAVPIVFAVIGKIVVFLIAIGVVIGFVMAFMLFRRT